MHVTHPRTLLTLLLLAACGGTPSSTDSGTKPSSTQNKNDATPSGPTSPATPSNQAPDADAGADQTVAAGEVVTLDGSLSHDPNGDGLKYQWTQTSGTNAALSDSHIASPTFTAPSGVTGSVLTFTLSVEDPAGLSANATTHVTVTPPPGNAIKYVFIVAMENQDSSTIYGNAKAPYINDLMKRYAYASSFGDELPALVSEPHYIWMEAGTNTFTDHTFTTDDDPSAVNSTSSVAHISRLLEDAGTFSWRSYQEDLPAPCPVASKHPYAAKHNPFVFFRDVSFTADVPDPNNAHCAAHHKDFSSLAGDLAAKTVANYNFISPNQCNDMHGALGCTNGCFLPIPGYGPCVQAGDDWLKANLPPMIAFAEANQGLVIVLWDEAESTSSMPFLLISPHLDKLGDHTLPYTHSAVTKSLSRIFNVPVLPSVISAPDLGGFFQPGYFP